MSPRQSLGATLHELLGNLNILHHNVERDLPAAIFPIFEVGPVEKLSGGRYRFRVDYASSRPGLAPLLRGALTQATLKLFNQELDIDTKLEAQQLGSKDTKLSPTKILNDPKCIYFGSKCPKLKSFQSFKSF